MHSLTEQSQLTGELPVVVNNLNITGPRGASRRC